MNHLGWYSRGYLPHLDAPGVCQAITFRLADSLPADVRQRMEQELSRFPEDQKSRRWRNRIHAWLDNGYGSCLLKQSKCAQCVTDAFRFFDGKRYDLIAWVVMPNHVHLLIRQYEGWPLGGVIRSWKGFTTKEIKNKLGHLLSGRVWQRGYWDRRIRDEHHFEAAVRYIANNPVKAGLVANASEWPWLGLPNKKEPHGNAAHLLGQ